jgi:histidinol-phosphate aminotransferase
MGLFSYYRQFEGMSEEEASERLRAEAEQRKREALARVEPLDLSRTTWPAYPPPSVVNAITFAARRGLHRYTEGRAGELRAELAHRHGVEDQRVVVGDGAARLLADAAQVLLEPGDELVTPWPSYPLYPAMARRARGRAVPVRGSGTAPVLEAVNDRSRLVALCNPNDPTGELIGIESLRALLAALPERVVLLLDEALRDFVAAEELDATLRLLDDHPRLLVFRTFSKAWGLAGLRCGYVIGGPGAEPLLEQLEPALGVNELAQAGALEALRTAGALVGTRAAAVAAERRRLLGELRARDAEATPSQANVVWLRALGLDGAELAHRLERAGVVVAPGGRFGDPAHIRVSVRDAPATDRFLAALDRVGD